MDKKVYDELINFLSNSFSNEFVWDIIKRNDGFEVTLNKLADKSSLEYNVQVCENLTNSKLITQVFIKGKHGFIFRYLD